jgi:hypothetical protein
VIIFNVRYKCIDTRQDGAHVLPAVGYRGRQGDLRIHRGDTERAVVQLYSNGGQGGAALVPWGSWVKRKVIKGVRY